MTTLFAQYIDRGNAARRASMVLALLVAAAPRTVLAQSVDGPARVLSVIHRVEHGVRSSSYRHELHVDERRGVFDWDCSSMAAWVLARSAPRALASVGRGRVLAIDFVRAIERVRAGEAHGGWLRVTRVGDVRPGDVLAWRRPSWFPSPNTGHVAFVVGEPQAWEGGYLLRIADASHYNHEDDTRNGGTGFGEGTILITTDAATGSPTGYGWAGRWTGPYVVPTDVVFGRPSH
jgi:hypothetical protein